jgi:hypothetical protein
VALRISKRVLFDSFHLPRLNSRTAVRDSLRSDSRSRRQQKTTRLNMITFSPIYLEDAEDICTPFFESPFLQMRLGKPGLWHGRAAQLLSTENPVRREAFENLLKGYTPDGSKGLVPEPGNPNRLAGWRVVLTLPPAMNRVWSVRSRGTRLHIERVFARAVRWALGHLERQLDDPLNGGERASLFAVFRTNAAQDLAPQLQATAVLFNLGIQRNGNAATFSLERIMALENQVKVMFERGIGSPLAKYREWGSVLQEKLDDCASPHYSMTADRRREWSGQDAEGNFVNKYPGYIGTWRSYARSSWTLVCFDDYWQFFKHPAAVLTAKLWENFDVLFMGAPRVHGRNVIEATTPPPAMERNYSESADTVRISPVFRPNVTDTFGPFFQRPLAQEMLAKAGFWHNDAAELLQLKNPVEPVTFYNLADGMTPDGSRSLVVQSVEANRLAGWRLVFTAPQLFNWGWSVTPWGVRRRFERAFEEAVGGTLTEMQRVMARRWDSMSKRDKSCLSAVFRTNATIDYSPQLQATALFFNFALGPDGSSVTFTTKQMMGLEKRIKLIFHEQFIMSIEQQAQRLSRYDRSAYGCLLGLLNSLEPVPGLCPVTREVWSGRNHEGMRSRMLPACFGQWKSETESFAQVSHDTDLHPQGNPASITEKLVQNYLRKLHRERVLGEQSAEATTAKEKKREQELELGRGR